MSSRKIYLQNDLGTGARARSHFALLSRREFKEPIGSQGKI